MAPLTEVESATAPSGEASSPRTGRERLVASALVAAAGIAGVLLVISGRSPLPLLGAVAVGVLLALHSRAGLVMGSVLGVVTAGMAGLVSLVAGRLTGQLVVVTLLVCAATTAVCAAALARNHRYRLPRPQWDRLPVLGALLGPAVWLGALAMARSRAAGLDIAWTMSGDARNNLLGMREYVTQGGLSVRDLLGASLSQGFGALVAAPGRASLPAQDLLQHDLTRVGELWTTFIVLACLLAGLLAAALTTRRTPLTTLVFAAVGSLIPLSWYVLGSGLENGYLNASLTLTFVTAGWVLVARSSTWPAAALAGIAALALLVVPTWFPMSVVVLGMALGTLWGARDGWRRTQPGRWAGVAALVVVASIAALSTVAVVLIPTVRNALVAEGGIYPLPRYAFLVVGGIAVVVSAWASSRADGRALFWGLAWAFACSLAMMLALLWIRRGGAVLWGYYPVKYGWMLTSSSLLVLWALLGRTVSAAGGALRRAVASGVAVLAVWALLSTFTVVGGAQNPVRFMLSGWGGPVDYVATRVFTVAAEGQDRFLWNYYDGPNDRIGNFWLALGSSDTPQAIRWAYLYSPGEIASLCELASLTKPVVVTRDAGLAEQVEESCPDADVTVEVVAGGTG